MKKLILVLFLALSFSAVVAQKNTTPGFYEAGTWGNLSLSTSLQTVTTGQANESDIVVLYVTNESSNASTITFADESGNTLGVIQVPASAGQNASTPPVNLLQPGFGMSGLELNPYGGYYFFLPASKILQAKVDSTTGGARRLFWKRKDY